jgi:hypothetical protein
MTSSNNTSGKHKIYEVESWGPPYLNGTKYFTVYWEHGITGFKYVYPNIMARDELDAYVIAMKKLEEGAEF